MVIIKEGDLSRLDFIKTFKCNACGCEFLADHTEYEYAGTQYNIQYYKCKCPTCHSVVYTED